LPGRSFSPASTLTRNGDADQLAEAEGDTGGGKADEQLARSGKATVRPVNKVVPVPIRNRDTPLAARLAITAAPPASAK
jgi:hypothetical protein